MTELIRNTSTETIDPLLQPMRAKNHAGSLRDLLFVMFWHRRKVVGFFIGATLLTILAVLAMPATYRSDATMLVPVNNSSAGGAAAALGAPTVTPVMYWEVQMKTELELLKSRQVAQSVVEEIGAGRVLRKGNDLKALSPEDALNKQALLALQQNLRLEVVPDSSILNVAYESGDAILARDIVTAYVDRYLKLRSEVNSRGHSADFLAAESEETQKKVQQVEAEIAKIKDSAGVGNIEEQRQILQQRIGAMQADITSARKDFVSAQAEVVSIAQQLKEIPQRIISTQTLDQTMSWQDELKKDISKLEQELSNARARYMPASPQVKIIEENLSNARKQLADNPDSKGERVEVVNPNYQALQSRVDNARANAEVAKAKEAALAAEVTSADAQLKIVNDVELKIKQLLRSVNLRETSLTLIDEAANREKLLAAFQKEKLNNVSIVQPATLPLKPIAPNRLMLLVLGMFVAATGAVGLGIAAEALSRTAKRPEDIERLSHLPSVSIGVIDSNSYVGTAARQQASSMLGRLLSSNSTDEKQTLVTRAAHNNSTAIYRPTTAGTLDVRPVRRWSPELLHAAHGIIDGLLHDSIRAARDQRAFVTGLISCRPGQGASTLSAYVASAVADRLEASLPLHPDDCVLLVDMDLAEPSLHRLLSIDESPGLSEWLSIHSVDAPPLTTFCHPTNHPRLSLMPAGAAGMATRMLDRMELLITQSQEHFRHMVVDLPPLSSSPTAMRLAARCNAVLLVVECGNMHQEVVRKSVRALQGAGANVAGVVLNKRRFPIPDWLYQRAS